MDAVGGGGGARTGPWIITITAYAFHRHDPTFRRPFSSTSRRTASRASRRASRTSVRGRTAHPRASCTNSQSTHNSTHTAHIHARRNTGGAAGVRAGPGGRRAGAGCGHLLELAGRSVELNVTCFHSKTRITAQIKQTNQPTDQPTITGLRGPRRQRPLQAPCYAPGPAGGAATRGQTGV